MAAPNYYLGNVSDLASNMQSMFQPNRTEGFPQSRPRQPLPVNPIHGPRETPMPQPVQPTGSNTGATSGPYPGAYNPLAAQAIRPTTFGQFDPSYAQNLSTYIGNSFQRPQANQALQFNPFGNLTDANVPYPSVGGMPGLPQTLLAWAQMFNPTALTTGQNGG